MVRTYFSPGWKFLLGRNRGLGRMGSLIDELTARGLLEAGLGSLDFDLARHGGIKGSRGSLARGRSPVGLGGHGRDHLRAVHGLARLLEHLGGGIQGAELLVLGSCFL